MFWFEMENLFATRPAAKVVHFFVLGQGVLGNSSNKKYQVSPLKNHYWLWRFQGRLSLDEVDYLWARLQCTRRYNRNEIPPSQVPLMGQ